MAQAGNPVINFKSMRASFIGVGLMMVWLLALCVSSVHAQVQARPDLPKEPASKNGEKEDVDKPKHPTGGKALDSVDPSKLVKRSPLADKGVDSTAVIYKPEVGRGGGKALDIVIAKGYRPLKPVLPAAHTERVEPRKEHKIEKPREEQVESKPRDLGTNYPEFVELAGGDYVMGANGEKAAEHHLEISKFQMSKTPITNWQFKLFVDDTGYKTEAETNPTPYEIEHGHINWRTFANNRENYPVVWITWNDAIAYGEWLTKVMVMLDPKSVDPLLEEQPDGSLAVKVENPYRLPSEAEWEFAARGGQAHPIYPWGDKPDPAVLNCKWDDRSESIESARKYIQPVANHSSNPYGLFDMAGNIDQWCYDWYSADYYTNSPEADPFGPAEGNERITRGGNWLSAPEACHVTSRHHLAPIDRNDYTGFRLARTVGDD